MNGLSREGTGPLLPDPSETAMQAETDYCRCVARGSTWQHPGVRGDGCDGHV
jgi:hypothetical protein